MNKIYHLLFFQLLAFSISAQPLFYQGTINGKIKIKMSLTKNEEEKTYSGQYFYESIGEKIKLEGKISYSQNTRDSIDINEYIGTETSSNAFFRGLFNKDGSFSGKWYSNTGKCFPFKLVLENKIKITYVTTSNSVFPQISGLEDTKIQQSINNTLTQYKKTTTEEKGAEDAEDVIFGTGSDFEIIYNGNNTITLLYTQVLYSYDITTDENNQEERSNHYTMGATTRYYSYNLKTGKELKYSDVLTENSKSFAKEKISLQLKEYCEQYIDEESLTEFLNSICLTQDGVMFQLPDCGAEGRFDYAEAFVIPYPKIKSYLNPNGLIKIK